MVSEKQIIDRVIEPDLRDRFRLRQSVWVEADAADDESNFLQDQFKSQSDSYISKYDKSVDYQKALISKFLQDNQVRSNGELLILDLGSGSGPSVKALLELFPHSKIVASDLSSNLLAHLSGTLNPSERDRCTLVQCNLEKHLFDRGVFDLVLGFAFLHHLFRPENLIKMCSEILKENGVALFFEPFENGILVLRLLYHQIISDPRMRELPENLITVLRGQIREIEVRSIKDKETEIFSRLDDKWLFSTHEIHTWARAANFRKCLVSPINRIDRPFTNQLISHARIGAGLTAAAIPDWVLSLAKFYDQNFGSEYFLRNPLEASIGLFKV